MDSVIIAKFAYFNFNKRGIETYVVGNGTSKNRVRVRKCYSNCSVMQFVYGTITFKDINKRLGLLFEQRHYLEHWQSCYCI